MAKFPEGPGLPKPLRDDNGLAAKAISDAADRRWTITEIPKIQKDYIDIMRVSLGGLTEATKRNGGEQAEVLARTLQDIILLA